MSLAETTARGGIASRVKNILLRPTPEWALIAAEPTTVSALFTRYAMPLAAIGPVCGVVGALLFSSAALARLGLHLSPVSLVISAVISYGVALLAVYVFGLVIDGLASNFGGTRDRVQAMKVAVYSSTAAWLAAVFQLVPALGVFGLVGLYGVFLLYKGLPIVMRTPPERAIGYTVSVVLVMLLVWIVLSVVVYFISTSLGLSPGLGAFMHHPVTGTTTSTTLTTTTN